MDIRMDLFNLGVALVDNQQKSQNYLQAKQTLDNAYHATRQAEDKYINLKLKIVQHLYNVTQDWLRYNIYVYDPTSDYCQRREIRINPLVQDKFYSLDNMTTEQFNECYPYEYSEGEYYVTFPVMDFSKVRLNEAQ